jgi:hypothetical protein
MNHREIKRLVEAEFANLKPEIQTSNFDPHFENVARKERKR